MPRFPALQAPEFRRYLTGNFISNIGTQMQAAALAYHVYQLTGSSAMVGLLGIVRVVPLLIFTLFGGVLADHADRRKVMLVTQSLMTFFALLLGLATASGAGGVWWIYVIVGFSCVAISFDGPARQSLVVSLVPTEHFPNAASINGIVWRFSEVIGPMIGGYLIASTLGLAACYFINAASFLAVIYAVYRMSPKPPAASNKQDQPRNLRDVLRHIGEGWAFVKGTPIIRHAMWIDFWATFFSAADALLPAMSKILKVGPQGYGMLNAAAAVGAFSAAAVLAYRPTMSRQGRWVIGMVGVYGLATVCFGLSTSFVLALVFLALTGAADMVSTVMRQTIRQLMTPDSMRGRMTATTSLFFISGPRLGDFESGALAGVCGERAAIVIGGGACMVVAALWSRAKALVDYTHESRSP